MFFGGFGILILILFCESARQDIKVITWWQRKKLEERQYQKELIKTDTGTKSTETSVKEVGYREKIA